MRQLHDQFAKECAAEMLEQLNGKVKIQHQMRGEVSYADLSFEPSPTAPKSIANQLGLFSKLATKPCLMEFFSTQPTKVEIRSCLAKLFTYHGELLRKSRREHTRLTEAELPQLWILTASASDLLLNHFGAYLQPPQWCEGVYFLGGPAYKTALLVLNRLPIIAETLWLRLLGRGDTQRQAVAELSQLPNGLLRDYLLELLQQLYLELKSKTTLTETEKELFMNLTPMYLKARQARQQAVQEGINQGRREGQREGRREGQREGQRVFVETLLKSRFGKLNKTWSTVIEGLLQLPPEEVAPLLLQASREELLAKFNRKKS